MPVRRLVQHRQSRLLNATFPVISKGPTGLHYRYMYLGAAYRADALPPPQAPMGSVAVIDINSIPPGLPDGIAQNLFQSWPDPESFRMFTGAVEGPLMGG